MKRKNTGLKIGIALLLVVIGVTVYAAVTASVSMKNVILVGDIEVQLHQQDASGKEVSNKEVTVSRGYQVERIVFAENTGTQPAFVRFSIESAFIDAVTGEKLSQDKIRLLLNEDSRWIYEDGWYYYAEVLEPGEQTIPILSGIQFDASLDESNQEDVLHLDITMHGLQAKNNAEDVLEAVGWPEG